MTKKFDGHTWTPELIRSEPNGAFDLFDANKDGVISVPELCFVSRSTNEEHRKRGNLFEEMKLFQLLDVDGDAGISREEFCTVVSDPTVMSDEALQCMAKLCEIVQEVHEESKEEPDGEDDQDDLEARKTAFNAALGVMNGMSISRRKSSRRLLFPIEEEKAAERYDLVLELVGVSIPGVDRPWYDVFSLTQPNTCNPFYVLYNEKGLVVERSATLKKSKTIATWDSLYVPADQLVDPIHVEFYVSVFAQQHNNKALLLGKTKPFVIPPPEKLPDLETAVGPFVAVDPRTNTQGNNDQDDAIKLLGTARWIPAENRTAVPKRLDPQQSCFCLPFLDGALDFMI